MQLLLETIVLFSPTILQSNGANVTNMSKGDPANTVGETLAAKTLLRSTRSGSSPASGVDLTVVGDLPMTTTNCTANSKTHVSRIMFGMSTLSCRSASKRVRCSWRGQRQGCLFKRIWAWWMDDSKQQQQQWREKKKKKEEEKRIE